MATSNARPLSHPTQTQFLVPSGNTIRVDGPLGVVGGGAIAVLVVDNTLTSHFWLNILPLASNPAVRYFIQEADLAVVADRLHVFPRVVPSFLVAGADGFFVDVFPAPLPAAGEVADPVALTDWVADHVMRYHK